MVLYVTFHFGFFFSYLFPNCICVNIEQIKEECIKKLQKIKRHTNHIVLHVYFFFLSCIPIKKYGVVSLGMGFDRLTACSWCGAKWVKASASRAEDPGFESCLHQDFSGVESYQ